MSWHRCSHLRVDLFKQIKSYHNHIIINAKLEAKKLGNSKVANMVLLGAASSFIPMQDDSFIQAIRFYFKGRSTRVADTNIKAFRKGQEMAKNFIEFVF